MGMIVVKKAVREDDQAAAFAVRYKVFVEGQQCDAGLEVAGNEEAVHFVAFADGSPAGAARYRRTAYGYKLERFAVLEAARGKGIGDALVKAVLSDLEDQTIPVYLHAQLAAVTLYERNGFRKEGEQFSEANMLHYKMVLDQ